MQKLPVKVELMKMRTMFGLLFWEVYCLPKQQGLKPWGVTPHHPQSCPAV